MMAGGFTGKRKELDQVVDGLLDFSLSGPAAKSRRLVSAFAPAPSTHILPPVLARLEVCGSPASRMLRVQFVLGSTGLAFRFHGSALPVGRISWLPRAHAFARSLLLARWSRSTCCI
jgi:hypothetical protein